MSKIEELFESYWAGVMQGKHPTYKLFRWHHKNGFMAGANYVLKQIEEFMDNINLGNSAAEKFYKLDLMADIHEFIEQLKSN